jgi:nicotinate-nucleotide adenylyltransferase
MRLGLLGGSFDPIHLGHIVIAEHVLRRLRLDRLILIPTFAPPHRTKPLASFRHRLEMARHAVAGRPGLTVSSIEEAVDGFSYTDETLKRFRRDFPTAQRLFLLGADQYRSMRTWRQPRFLPCLASLVVMSRPGVRQPRLLRGHSRTRVRFLTVPAVTLSATHIRARLASSESVRYMLPTPVRSYISRHRLYRSV